MRRFRAVGSSVTVALAALLLMRAHGQSAVAPRVVIDRAVPPAIESGTRPDVSRSPDSPETRERLTLRGMSTPVDRADSRGRVYIPGRVIVKFRDAMSNAARVASLASASPTAAIGARPSYADFDIVTIDATENAEAVVRTLSGRPEVEY